MKSFGFLVAHGYQILKGFVYVDSKEDAIKMVENGEWDDIIDEDDIDEFTEGYEIVDMWEID